MIQFLLMTHLGPDELDVQFLKSYASLIDCPHCRLTAELTEHWLKSRIVCGPKCARHTTLPSNKMGGSLDAMWQRISVLCTLLSPRQWFHSFFPWAYIAHSASFVPSSHWSKVSISPHFHPSLVLQMDLMIVPSLLTTSIFTSFLKHVVSPFLKTRLKKTHFISHTRCIFILYLPLLAKLVRKVYTGVSDSILGCNFTSKSFPGDSDG